MKFLHCLDVNGLSEYDICCLFELITPIIYIQQMMLRHSLKTVMNLCGKHLPRFNIGHIKNMNE